MATACWPACAVSSTNKLYICTSPWQPPITTFNTHWNPCHHFCGVNKAVIEVIAADSCGIVLACYAPKWRNRKASTRIDMLHILHCSPRRAFGSVLALVLITHSWGDNKKHVLKICMTQETYVRVSAHTVFSVLSQRYTVLICNMFSTCLYYFWIS